MQNKSGTTARPPMDWQTAYPLAPPPAHPSAKILPRVKMKQLYNPPDRLTTISQSKNKIKCPAQQGP